MLILGCEMIFPEGPAQMVEGFQRFAFGVQRLAPPAREAAWPPDRVDPVFLVGFGDRRKADNLAGLLRENKIGRAHV